MQWDEKYVLIYFVADPPADIGISRSSYRDSFSYERAYVVKGVESGAENDPGRQAWKRVDRL